MSLLIVIVLASLLSGAHAAGAHGSYYCVGPWMNARTSPGRQAPRKKKDAQPGKRTVRSDDDPLATQRRATALMIEQRRVREARTFHAGTPAVEWRAVLRWPPRVGERKGRGGL